MKKLVCTLLIVALTFSSLAIFSPTVKAQTSPWRTVWENPCTLTTFHRDNQVNSTFYTFPKVIWNGTQYIDYIFNPSDMSAGVGSVYLKVSRDSTVFYDPYRKEEVIQGENWVAEYLDTISSSWTTDFPVECNVYSLVNSSGIYFNRHATLGSGAAFDIWYWLRVGSTLKISVILHPAQNGEFRLLWLLENVSATSTRWLTTTENVTAQLVDDKSCSHVQFTGENESCFVDWSDARFLNKTSQRLETYFQTLELQKKTSDRCQAKISFGNFTLPRGESVVLDPTVVTFNSNASLDGWIEREGDSYPPNDESYVDKDGSSLHVGQYNMFPSFPLTHIFHCCRSYLSFDTSSVPALAYNVSAKLKLKTYWDDSVVDFTVKVMGGAQPIYKEDLTVNCWDNGTAQVAAWNTADYPGDNVYVNLTIPANEINKAGGTAFELKSSRDNDSIPQAYQDEIVEFYSGNSTGNEPKLEVSYCLDTLTIGPSAVHWFYRNVSNGNVVIVLFGGHPFTNPDFISVNGIDEGGEKNGDKIKFLDAMVENGFSLLTPQNDHTDYWPNSAWIEDATVWLMDNQSYAHVFLFGFSGGGTVVGYEIQKDYATRFSAAVMSCAPVNWDSYSNGTIYQSAHTASKAKVATCFPQPLTDDAFYHDVLRYYNNELVHKQWHNWTGGHDFFGQICMEHPGENASKVVIDWYNAAHPPSTPFTPSGPDEGYAKTSYGYTSGTVDPNGDNVRYQFDWGDGTSDTTGYVSSGTNVTVYHSWNSTGLHNVTVRAEDATNPGAWSPPNTVTLFGAGDINHDNTVDIYDAISLANAFNSNTSSPNWNSAADLNNDNTVDIYDAIILANNWGNSYESGLGCGTSGQPLSGGAMTEGGASVLVDPSSTTVFKGEVFTVNVKVTSVTDLRGWEFKLYWNSTLLNCTDFVIQTPTEWQGKAQNYGEGLEAGYNATHARLWIAQAANYPAPSFNGSMTLATLTFQALQTGTTPLTLADTNLGNSTAQPMDHADSSGSVSVYYGRYMRSDTKTVNGLNVYLLNATRTTSGLYQSANANGQWPVTWGIRAWVRHSNGTEQEITLDGQTGTPKAQVSRSSGYGMQSNTVSVTQRSMQTTDSLVVRVYMDIGGGGWTLAAAFTTEQLGATTLTGTTWTVYYYSWATYNRITDKTYGRYYWGSSAYDSRIQNLQYG